MPTQLVCHRGASLLAPENTFASAEKALEIGGDILEFDIRQSSDGVLYVLHDETVDRTSNGVGNIAELSSFQIDKLDAGSWFDGSFSGERVPRLEEYLMTFRGRCQFYLEVKYADCQKIAELVKKMGIEEECYTFSFDAEMRKDMRIHAPDIRRMVSWKIAGSPEAVIKVHHAQIVEFYLDNLDPLNVQLCQASGLEISFYTDEPNVDVFEQLIDLDIDYVNIDYQELFLEVQSKKLHKTSI